MPLLGEFDLKGINDRPLQADHQVMPFRVVFPPDVDSSQHGGFAIKNEQLAMVYHGPGIEDPAELQLRFMSKIGGNVGWGPEARWSRGDWFQAR